TLSNTLSKDHSCCIIQERFRCDLRHYLKTDGNYIEEETVLIWISDILNGMNSIKSKNIPYKDLKLDNIFVSFSMRLSIGDFGYSQLTQDEDLANASVHGSILCYPPEWLNSG